jgi:hypothetical protein
VKRGAVSRFARIAVLLLLTSSPSLAQTFGLKFAYPTADALQVTAPTPVTYSIHSLAPKFGVTGELNLPAGLLLELDALYSHLSYRSSALPGSTTTINSWDLPLLVKKPFTEKAIRPFVNAGLAFRAVNEDTYIGQIKVKTPEFIHQTTAGYAAGFGLDFRFGKFHLMPEFRYSHFQRDNFRSSDGSFHSNLNQPMFLLGLQRGR